MSKKTLAVATLAVLCLTGCSLFDNILENRDSDYQHVEESAELQLPESVSTLPIRQLYPIPAIRDNSVVPHAFEAPRPQRASLAAFEKQVKIQTLDGTSWILVQISPDRAWPEIRNVLTRNGILIESLNAPAGIIETVWVNYEGDEDKSHRYRVKVEPGVQFNTSEIFVLHNSAAKGDEQITEWLPTSSDTIREKELRTMIAEALTGDIDNSSVSLLAQTIGGEAKVETISTVGQQPYILIKLDFARAWASISYSLNNKDGLGEFSVIDQDRSAGVFYAQHQGRKKKSGLFGWFDSDDTEHNRRVDYHITATKVDRGIEVRITNPDGSLLERSETLRLLKEIRSNLS